MSRTLHPPGTEPRSIVPLPEHPPSVRTTLHAVLFASACVLFGVMWDISWHSSIGRDTFWSPPHLAIYLGGIVAGLGSGLLVLRLSFRGTAEERAATVRFWGPFRGPLGAWICIWGALAMVVSAPFDDWWHNAYGLDVEIISPPHAVLALGIGAINLGALVMVLPWLSRARDAGDLDEVRRLGRLHALAAGLLLLMAATFNTELSFRLWMHSSQFWLAAARTYPWILVAAAVSSGLRWPTTSVAAVYTVARLLVIWTLPLFPAEPKLAPILTPVDHMVAPDFPLLLVVPALAMDMVLQRWRAPDPEPWWSDWALAAVLGGTFMVVFAAAQWPFSFFLHSEWSRNWFFATENAPYSVGQDTYWTRREFYPWDQGPAALRAKLAQAMLIAMASARVGLWLGGWMRRVRR